MIYGIVLVKNVKIVFTLKQIDFSFPDQTAVQGSFARFKAVSIVTQRLFPGGIIFTFLSCCCGQCKCYYYCYHVAIVHALAIVVELPDDVYFVIAIVNTKTHTKTNEKDKEKRRKQIHQQKKFQ